MSDLVKRLRAPAYWFSGSSEGHEGENSAPLDAASTIERLRVELTRINMENDRLTRTNRAKREHRNKLLHEITRLRAALAESADELDAYYRMEYPGDHPYNKAKLAQALASNPARAALKETSDG